MKVKELPQWLQDLAWQRCKEYVSSINEDLSNWSEEDALGCMFPFDYTPEGYEFWSNIYHKKIIPEQNVE